MTPEKSSLIVTAHPDDESLFFAGLILTAKDIKYDLLCLTSGKTDGREGERTRELERAGEQLGIRKVIHGGLIDDPKLGLNQESAFELFEKTLGSRYGKVYTHSALGEYGHSHHQDCSYFCHSFFEGKHGIPVMSVAFNIPADEHILLQSAQFKKKAKVLTEIYKLETRRFYNLLPITSTESFSRIGYEEAEVIYQFLKTNVLSGEEKINYHQGILPLLKARPLSDLVENFFAAYFSDESI